MGSKWAVSLKGSVVAFYRKDRAVTLSKQKREEEERKEGRKEGRKEVAAGGRNEKDLGKKMLRSWKTCTGCCPGSTSFFFFLTTANYGRTEGETLGNLV